MNPFNKPNQGLEEPAEQHAVQQERRVEPTRLQLQVKEQSDDVGLQRNLQLALHLRARSRNNDASHLLKLQFIQSLDLGDQWQQFEECVCPCFFTAVKNGVPLAGGREFIWIHSVWFVVQMNDYTAWRLPHLFLSTPISSCDMVVWQFETIERGWIYPAVIDPLAPPTSSLTW